MSSAPVINIDPVAFWAHPYPILAEMRDATPICFVPELGATLITPVSYTHLTLPTTPYV